MSERFNLKWNDFHSNVSKSFGLLREEEYLHDVTLITDDNTQISAHKLVLSACSDYFKGVFKNNKKHYHPLICLNGLSSEDLKNILDYMYNGEVKIFQEDLDRFLEVAQRLRLEGIMEKESDEKQQEIFVQNKAEARTTHSSFSKLNAKSNEDDIFEEKRSFTNEIVNVEKIAAISTNIQELEEQINQYLEKCQDGLYSCLLCGRTGNRSRNLKNHIETHIEGLKFPCEKCGQTFRSRNALNQHIFYKHKVNGF